jgi:hypothetical protein
MQRRQRPKIAINVGIRMVGRHGSKGSAGGRQRNEGNSETKEDISWKYSRTGDGDEGGRRKRRDKRTGRKEGTRGEDT